MLDKLTQAVASVFKTPQPNPTAAPPSEAAWSESSLYRGADFPKYNPDSLIGRKGYAIYDKMMTDEQVKAVVHFKRDAVTSRGWRFDCAHPDLSEEENAQRKELFTALLGNTDAPLTDYLNSIMSAMQTGFSMTEKVLDYTEHAGRTWVGVKDLKLKPCDTFFFHTDEFGNIDKVVQKFDGKEQELDINAFIHFVQNPDKDRHYGRSELREAYRAWFSKDMAIKFQNIHMERFSAGFVVAKPTAGKSITTGTNEYNELVKALNNIQAKTSILLPANIDLEVLHPGTSDIFEKAIAQHDKSIAKALLVPNLLGISEQGQVGSYSQSATQLQAFFWTLDKDVARLEGAINKQLIRSLGDMNFGDGKYPTFKLNPLSDEKKLELAKLWLEMVKGGAVKTGAEDEVYIREALGMPKKKEVNSDAGEDVVLNGAQVQSLVDIIAKVTGGQLTPEAAKLIIVAAFPITEEVADKMVADAVPPEPVDPAAQPGQPGQPEEAPQQPPVNKQPPAHQEETIVGKMGISVSALSRAMKRVDFAVIGNKADNNAADSAYEIAKVNGAAVKRLMSVAENLSLGTADGSPADIAKIVFTAAELSKMKAAAISGLKEAWKIGESHAKKEVAKARGASFATNDLSLQDIAAEYFASRGYTLSGDISTATQKVIRNILLDGIKNSKSFDDTRKAIYKALESDGLLTEEDVAEALGTTTVTNTNARIETAMRTVSFEAINEARYNFFSDPELSGYVEALEYSAILDDRTTEICSQLNGQTYGIDDDVWSTFRPPNHFNCRSILIPVTIDDTWSQSEPPSSMPQKGFGFSKLEKPAHKHGAIDEVKEALASLSKEIDKLKMSGAPASFTINIDHAKEKTTKRIKQDADGNYILTTITEETDREQG